VRLSLLPPCSVMRDRLMLQLRDASHSDKNRLPWQKASRPYRRTKRDVLLGSPRVGGGPGEHGQSCCWQLASSATPSEWLLVYSFSSSNSYVCTHYSTANGASLPFALGGSVSFVSFIDWCCPSLLPAGRGGAARLPQESLTAFHRPGTCGAARHAFVAGTWSS